MNASNHCHHPLREVLLRQAQTPVLIHGEVRVPRHFPQKTVGSGKISRVASPRNLDRAFDHRRTGRAWFRQDRINLTLAGDIAGDREAGKACIPTPRGKIRIGSQILSWEECENLTPSVMILIRGSMLYALLFCCSPEAGSRTTTGILRDVRAW